MLKPDQAGRVHEDRVEDVRQQLGGDDRRVLAPLRRAASMYSSTMTRRVADSATRAIGAMYTMLTEMITLSRPGPSDAPIAIASRIAGNPYIMSRLRISTDRTAPPTYPANAPIAVPIAVAISTGAKPASSESWPP